ncbi:homocysteine S-methyltransferase [Thalassotalea psychrophila]|uniref:Homocysteine S-methyltransferase n=1 Tax=Thalassotalea psychrophila TaxID=3065647 RepID=A0ABY9TXJ5_9GAMM|nr:homocysteine S-methyltransferase [Colwelliaceae bacterium SQ149]
MKERQQNPIFDRFPFIIDGGLATQLESSGFNLNNHLWSAKLLLENPQAIVEAHLAYLNAGAKCIISASYQASIQGFIDLGLTLAEAENTIKSSVELARQAVDKYMKLNPTHFKPIVAASIGPYGAYLADGSEYTGDYQISDNDLFQFHQRRLNLLASTSADILACETIPNEQEALILSDLITSQRKPAWMTFSCRDEKNISSGSLLKDVAGKLQSNQNIIAVGINCTSPQFVESLILELKSVTTKHIVVYPNSGECFHADTKTWHGTADPIECAIAAKSWSNSGADIIGGCCRMGPDHIKAMVNNLL